MFTSPPKIRVYQFNRLIFFPVVIHTYTCSWTSTCLHADNFNRFRFAPISFEISLFLELHKFDIQHFKSIHHHNKKRTMREDTDAYPFDSKISPCTIAWGSNFNECDFYWAIDLFTEDMLMLFSFRFSSESSASSSSSSLSPLSSSVSLFLVRSFVHLFCRSFIRPLHNMFGSCEYGFCLFVCCQINDFHHVFTSPTVALLSVWHGMNLNSIFSTIFFIIFNTNISF